MMLLVAMMLAAAPPTTSAKPRAVKVPRADAPRVTTAVVPARPALAGKGSPMPKGGTTTECSHCHATTSWADVRFNHDRTGFPLDGAHTTVTCKACHVVDFERPLPRSCVGCHRDAHAGDLGSQCESCHDTSTWRSRVDADAHRRTNFPLLGGHAAIPCIECHFEARERRFARATVDCLGCHEQDWARTVGTGIDHQTRGFDTQQCRTCHGSYRFTPALFPQHDDCFAITTGPHAGEACADCHAGGQFGTAAAGTCNTGTLQCTSCHEHLCADMDTLHADLSVAGYQCVDRKCYECHQDTGATP